MGVWERAAERLRCKMLSWAERRAEGEGVWDLQVRWEEAGFKPGWDFGGKGPGLGDEVAPEVVGCGEDGRAEKRARWEGGGGRCVNDRG